MTKLLACPGLRLGYIVARTPEEATRLRELRPQWSINAIAAAALPDLMEQADLEAWSKSIGVLRHQLSTLLADHGLQTSPAAANYVWVESAPGLRDALLPYGVLIRSGASFGHPDAVRIAVPNDSGLSRLEVCLKQES